MIRGFNVEGLLVLVLAAFLFILTSAVSPLVDLTYLLLGMCTHDKNHLVSPLEHGSKFCLCIHRFRYFNMVKMTAPYTVMLTLAGLAGILTMDLHD